MPAVLPPANVEMLSRREVAERWSVSIDTVRRREQEGLLPAIRFNSRLLRYRLDDVEAIDRRLLGPGEEDEPERAFPARAIWRNRDHDKPVAITGVMGVSESGEKYFAAEGGSGIPESELVFS